MAWNNRLWTVLVLLLIAIPSASVQQLEFSAPAGAADTPGNELTNESIASPAFLQLILWWNDGMARFTALKGDQYWVRVTGPSIDIYTHAETIPVESVAAIRVRIYANSMNAANPLYDTTYTSGAAGSYQVLSVQLSTEDLARGAFMPVRVIFRPYDSTTGAGLPVEQFNITIQFADQGGIGLCGGDTCYVNAPETPIGLGYLDTYFGLVLRVRVRDYFGNLLYNSTRQLNFTNESSICIPVAEPAYAGQCGILTSSFLTWDIPLAVYSVKFFNQKPDQFTKFDLHWNGTGAGEEIFAPNGGLVPPWWNSAYTYRQRLAINASTVVPVGYDFNLSFSASSYVTAGKILADYRDLRVVWWSGSAWTELNRSYDGANLFFKAQAQLSAGATDRNYFLFYGNPLAGSAPTFLRYHQLVLAESSLRGYWPLNETSGTVATDKSGRGHDGTYAGSPLLGQSGIVNRSTYFRGIAGERLLVPSHSDFAVESGDFTLELWILRSGDGIDNWDGLIIGGCYSRGLQMATNRFLNGIGAPILMNYASAPLNVWYMLDVTHKLSTKTLNAYINGNLAATLVYSGSLAVTGHEVEIGYDTCETPNRVFKGLNDEAAIYASEQSQPTIAARWAAGVNQSSDIAATVSLDSSQGFAWFNSPGETVERFLNPGYYEVTITTDNRTGPLTKATLGFNVTEANYFMVSGTNITRFIGDFNSIYSQTQIISNAFRPDVIEYGQLLPSVPTQIKMLSADETFELIHPFSVLTGSSSYPAAAGTNLTLYAPNMSSESGADGSLLTTLSVTQDQFVFSGADPGLTHVWINYTNGTNIWENATLPPSVTLAGIQGDVWVVTNRTVQTTRTSTFRAIWEFSFAYYATPKRYEATLSLNNSMNRTVLNAYWFVGFPENRTINISSSAVKDLDNNFWMTMGLHFEVAQSGFYMTFDRLNASQIRKFFFQFWDLNATGGQSVPILQVSQIEQGSLAWSSNNWNGRASFASDFSSAYSGDIVIKFTCLECERIRWETVEVLDETTGRQLDTTEFFAGSGSVTISSTAVGTVEVGGARNYQVSFRLQLTPDDQSLSFFRGYLGPVSIFMVLVGVAVLMGALTFSTPGTTQELRDRRGRYFWAFAVIAIVTILVYLGRPEGLGFVS